MASDLCGSHHRADDFVGFLAQPFLLVVVRVFRLGAFDASHGRVDVSEGFFVLALSVIDVLVVLGRIEGGLQVRGLPDRVSDHVRLRVAVARPFGKVAGDEGRTSGRVWDHGE